MNPYRLKPQDLLFFRDARPMEAGQGSGHGAVWPLPNIFFDALHSALHRAYETPVSGEPVHNWRRRSAPGSRGPQQRFGDLKACGPYPCLPREDGKSEWFLPAPQDVVSAPGGRLAILAPLTEPGGASDLPQPLKYPVAGSVPPDKAIPPRWWSKSAIESYLGGELPALAQCRSDTAFFLDDRRIGIGINAETKTQDGESIYQAEYLQMLPEAALGVAASMGEENSSLLDQLFPEPGRILIAGGQQRMCEVHPDTSRKLSDLLPVAPKMASEATRIKVVLLSPALFPADAKSHHPGGWLPSWVDHRTGQVLLPQPDEKARKNGESRNVWRKRLKHSTGLDVHLVAARIPGSVPISGWSTRSHWDASVQGGPEPLLLGVPAGSVYYFEGRDAAKLAAALNWHGEAGASATTIANRISAARGEQGFGLAVCGKWTPLEEEQTN